MQCRRPGFYPWIGKITWRREKLTSSVFWSREFQGLSRPWHHKESDTTEQLSLTHCSFLYPKGFIQSSWSIRNHEIKSMERGKYQIRSVAQLCPTLCDPMDCSLPWNSPGQNTGEGSFSLLQVIFPTQGSNPGLPHCRGFLYQAEPQGKPWF